MGKISIGYKDIDVEVTSYTEHPAKILWDALKQTWIELQGIDYDPDNEIVAEMVDGCLNRRYNPTPQEMISVQCVFHNISRVNLAQLTRHRGVLFSAESQMPQAVKDDVILPLNIAKSKYADEAIELIKEAQDLYDRMVDGNDLGPDNTNIPWQDARYLLFNGQTTNIFASFTMPQLASASGQRLENNTADEINYAFRKLLKNFREKVDADNQLDKLDKMVYLTLIDRCDAFGANAKKCFIADRVFGNSFKRFEDGSPVTTKATETKQLDFSKSAWYYELKRIADEEPELLLNGESEMIDSWE